MLVNDSWSASHRYFFGQIHFLSSRHCSSISVLHCQAGVYEAVSAEAGLIRIGGLQPEFDLTAARLCLNFVLISTSGSNKLAASCVLQEKSATWQASGVNAPGGAAQTALHVLPLHAI